MDIDVQHNGRLQSCAVDPELKDCWAQLQGRGFRVESSCRCHGRLLVRVAAAGQEPLEAELQQGDDVGTCISELLWLAHQRLYDGIEQPAARGPQ